MYQDTTSQLWYRVSTRTLEHQSLLQLNEDQKMFGLFTNRNTWAVICKSLTVHFLSHLHPKLACECCLSHLCTLRHRLVQYTIVFYFKLEHCFVNKLQFISLIGGNSTASILECFYRLYLYSIRQIILIFNKAKN